MVKRTGGEIKSEEGALPTVAVEDRTAFRDLRPYRLGPSAAVFVVYASNQG
jgi:hypothetical protein